MLRLAFGLMLVGQVGCLPTQEHSSLVPSNPFAGPTPIVTPPAMSPATEEASLRVAKVGQKVVAANPQLGIKPFFATVGASSNGPAPEEIFHTGADQIVITETLVRKCKTEGQLAAVLAVELAKMSAEGEFRPAQVEDNGPPMVVPVGSESNGTFGPADRAVELANYDKKHARGLKIAPDPRITARGILTRADFTADELETVAPLLKAAEQNIALEKQMAR